MSEAGHHQGLFEIMFSIRFYIAFIFFLGHKTINLMRKRTFWRYWMRCRNCQQWGATNWWLAAIVKRSAAFGRICGNPEPYLKGLLELKHSTLVSESLWAWWTSWKSCTSWTACASCTSWTILRVPRQRGRRNTNGPSLGSRRMQQHRRCFKKLIQCMRIAQHWPPDAKAAAAPTAIVTWWRRWWWWGWQFRKHCGSRPPWSCNNQSSCTSSAGMHCQRFRIQQPDYLKHIVGLGHHESATRWSYSEQNIHIHT